MEECFSKCGVLQMDFRTGEAKVKLYTTAEGWQKGDALVSFAKAASVELACTMRDGYDFRDGHVLKVWAAAPTAARRWLH